MQKGRTYCKRARTCIEAVNCVEISGNINEKKLHANFSHDYLYIKARKINKYLYKYIFPVQTFSR